MSTPSATKVTTSKDGITIYSVAGKIGYYCLIKHQSQPHPWLYKSDPYGNVEYLPLLPFHEPDYDFIVASIRAAEVEEDRLASPEGRMENNTPENLLEPGALTNHGLARMLLSKRDRPARRDRFVVNRRGEICGVYFFDDDETVSDRSGIVLYSVHSRDVSVRRSTGGDSPA